jgi:ATP-binding cassette subfamily B protein
LHRILKYVKPYRITFGLTAVLTITSAFLGPVRPVLIQYTLDNSILTPRPDLLLWLTIAMVGILVIETFVQYHQTYLANKVGQTVIKDIRTDLYTKISHFKLKYFDTHANGTLVTRVISDIETIADVFSNGILVILGDLLKLVIIVLVMFYTDWRLTLFCLSTIPFLLLATNWFKNTLKRAYTDVRNEVARLNAFVQEHITGVAIVQAFNKEKTEASKFREINASHRNAHIRTVYANAIFFPVVELLSAISLALMVWFGAKEVIPGHTSFGNLVAFIMYINMLFRPIRQLADRFSTLQMGLVSAERVFKLLDTEEQIADSGERIATTLKGEIEFDKVWFAYKEEDWVLRNVSFDAQPGTMVAIVGATGAGKTSIINLVNRLYEFQKGEIRIDGNDLRSYAIHPLRAHIAVVLQDVFLFSDTIYNNITLRNPNISSAEVEEAATAVGAHRFIASLPGGYNFDVKERGALLSAGQRQLLAFIRAYLYNPSILILDEATSSIDSETEVLISEATEKITHRRTSIVIAHRLSTIRKADMILVMDRGEIVERGRHEDLLTKNGYYRRLYENQFAPQPSL